MWTITTVNGAFECKHLSYIGVIPKDDRLLSYGEVKVEKIETLIKAWEMVRRGCQFILETPRPEGDPKGVCDRILLFSMYVIAIELTDDAEEE